MDFDELVIYMERARRLGARGEAEEVVAKLLIEGAPYEEVVKALPPDKAEESFVTRAHTLGARGKATRRIVNLLKQGASFEEVEAALNEPKGWHPKFGFIKRR